MIERGVTDCVALAVALKLPFEITPSFEVITTSRWSLIDAVIVSVSSWWATELSAGVKWVLAGLPLPSSSDAMPPPVEVNREEAPMSDDERRFIDYLVDDALRELGLLP
ncbi:MAG: hypothetical protein NT062_36745 [Proteobacteria bacterium]|nr:hypothetical protein [Pseudomonadota bacterium]